ncbi:uncharacterized protein EV420DRAFT_1280722 [Desarmillaria tabescens]|uniref:Uncharacterized protein n=1 Tax=Armillaria tabescens TaxID=1929756 RepID=A0AA39J9J9_ARMTA|nr:uncharacterized protein EV420DRAFT_1280722 [Desarmillaria tabescens]KAK0437304.1 hypothetical protein EV420DRAFT_1280722 [Desarmillaria tabescens]
MWSLTLRYGWRSPKNEKMGFIWLRKAADLALGMGGKEEIKNELVLAMYGVGRCFFPGWGDQKNVVVSYSRWNDSNCCPDAQSDLAFFLANRKGCKHHEHTPVSNTDRSDFFKFLSLDTDVGE